ncbi:MAG: tetratricopeptide repeat protein [Deltaproteobacteria bacterium]|nr:tetratricopeptide repeat protein [Deltaproteobacteria bacterium]
MSSAEPTISLCIIAKDEEEFIGQAISSVLPLVHEVIVVDTGSTDKTCEIARNLGAKVEHFPWNGDFSAPRNFSLKKATGDWILVLDADEAIDESDFPRIRELIKDRTKCYRLTQRHYSNDPRLSDFKPVTKEFPKWEKNYGGYFESSLVRLFPNREGIEYIGRVHELVEHSIAKLSRHKIVEPGIRIHHYGHTPEVKAKKNKGELYTPLGQAKLGDDPSFWQSYFELGVEHNNNGRRKESIAAFLKAVELNPRYVPAWVNLGYVFCEEQMYKEAVSALQSALKLDPRSAEAYCNLGVVYLRIPHLPTAEKYFTAAVKLKPDYVNAICNLGKSLAYQKRYAEAAFYFRRALEYMPQCTPAKLDLGIIHFASNNFEQAEKWLTAVLQEDKACISAYFHLGQLYQATKRLDAALNAVDRLCNHLSGITATPQDAALLESARMQRTMLKKKIEEARMEA